MGPRPHLWICSCKTACLPPELIVSIGPRSPSMDLCKQNKVLSTKITSLYRSQTSPVDLCTQNRDFRTRITSLYGSQTLPVVLCIQNSVLTIRIASLYGSQLSSVVFACKTTKLGPELQVSMSPSPHLWFLHAKQRL